MKVWFQSSIFIETSFPIVLLFGNGCLRRVGVRGWPFVPTNVLKLCTLVVLSDPVILSRNRDYGVTDLGPEGISSFFSQHECNNYCRPHWTRPARPIQYFRPVAGTSMIRHSVPTASSRPGGSLIFGWKFSWGRGTWFPLGREWHLTTCWPTCYFIESTKDEQMSSGSLNEVHPANGGHAELLLDGWRQIAEH